MKTNNFILTMIIISGISLLYGCQEGALTRTPTVTVSDEPAIVTAEPDEPNVPDEPLPELAFDTTSIDFGEIGPGTTSNCEFNFTNTGEGTLVISEIKGCCGIVTTLEKSEYVPGESGTIKVIFHETSGQIGTANREFTVLSNDVKNPEIALSTKAEVVARVECEPERITLFLEEENAACPNLDIRCLDGKEFSITQVISTANCITADFDSSVGSTEFTLALKADVEALASNRTGTIQITITHPEADSITIPYNIIPKYSISPQNILIYYAQEQKPERKIILVKNMLSDDFEIESITSENDTLEVVSLTKEQNTYKIEVDITPPEQNGNIRFLDRFNIQIEGEQKLEEITCTGYYDNR